MDGQPFAYDGKSGRWIFYIYLAHYDGLFSGAADITFDGEQRCKLVLSMPDADGADGVEILKGKCIAWIEQVDHGESGASPRPVLRYRR